MPTIRSALLRALRAPFALLALALLPAVLGLAACGDDAPRSGRGGAPGEAMSSKPLRVGVSPVPHGEILDFVRDRLAAGAGLRLDVVEYADYVGPNRDLERGRLDANYFQIPAYLAETNRTSKTPLVAVARVHIEPLALYSRRLRSVRSVPRGAVVALPKGDVTTTRALRLLASGGLITLRDDRATTITTRDITGNPRGLRFDPVDPARTPAALDRDALAVINGNYALEAGLSPIRDALLMERTADNPNVNLLVTTEAKRNDPRIRTLARLLRSEAVRQFIARRYKGAVVPVR